MMKNALFCSQKARASDSTALCWSLTGEMPGQDHEVEDRHVDVERRAGLEYRAVVAQY